MHSTSLHVGYPRIPFKFRAFINALLFSCHTSGLKLFPGGSVLLRPRSNAGLHLRYPLAAELQRRVGRRRDEYPLVQDTVSSPLNRSSS